ncbi:MAG: chorismate mutase, partial [Treponema sp.]|nr:chorismate mutase [Treponema sp.]
GMMRRVVRIMVSVYMPDGSVPRNVYLGDAEKLRPDFAKAGRA